MKNLLHRNIIFAALIGAGLATPLAQAHPLAKIMPFAAFEWAKSLFTTHLRLNNKDLFKRMIRYQTDEYRDHLDASTNNPADEDYINKVIGLVTLRAKHLYGFESQYPILIDYSLPVTPASTTASLIKHNGELQAINKRIYLHNRSAGYKDNDILTFELMHEHEHLFKDHGLQKIKLAQALNTNKSVTFNNVTISSEAFSKDKGIISRLCEQEADAAIQMHASLCRAATGYFRQCLQSIRQDSYDHTISLLDDPEELKKHERGDSHPHHKRRFLYFKKWAEAAEKEPKKGF